jgi:hypothetical protein
MSEDCKLIYDCLFTHLSSESIDSMSILTSNGLEILLKLKMFMAAAIEAV